MLPSLWLRWTAPARLTAAETDVSKAREALQQAMTVAAGVVRDGASLAGVRPVLLPEADRVDVCELRNLATVAGALVAAATVREESRGCHTRTDFPETSAAFARRIVIV